MGMIIVNLRRGRTRGRHKSLGAYLYWIISDNTFESRSLAFFGILEDHTYALGCSHQGIIIFLTYLFEATFHHVKQLDDFHDLRLLVFGFPQQLSRLLTLVLKYDHYVLAQASW